MKCCEDNKANRFTVQAFIGPQMSTVVDDPSYLGEIEGLWHYANMFDELQ